MNEHDKNEEQTQPQPTTPEPEHGHPVQPFDTNPPGNPGGGK